MTSILELIERLEKLEKPDRELDVAIACRFPRSKLGLYRPGGDWFENPGQYFVDYEFERDGLTGSEKWEAQEYTRDMMAALQFIRGWLPNWFWTCGRCDLSGHASIGPDYNSKKDGVRELLLAKFPIDQFHQGFDADLEPGGSDFRVACALMHCALQALELIEQMKGDIHYAYSSTA